MALRGWDPNSLAILAAPPPPRPRSRLRQVILAASVALYVIWAGCAWWSAIRPADVSRGYADAAAGRVTSYQLGDHWSSPSFWGSRTEPSPSQTSLSAPAAPTSAERGGLLAWTTTDGRTFATAPGFPVRGADIFTSGGSGGTAASTLAVTMSAHGATAGLSRGTAGRLATTLPRLAITVFLLVLYSAGPPRRATRWCWFWLAWLPLGLGLLAWLFTEGRPARPPIDGYPARYRRGSGWNGVGVLVLGMGVIPLGVMGLRALLGPDLVPHF